MFVMAELTVDQPPMRAGERYAMPDQMARDLVSRGHARNIGAFPPSDQAEVPPPEPAPARARPGGTYRTKGMTRG